MAEADLRRELDTLRKDLATLRGDVTTLSETAGKTTKETIQEIMDAAKEATANARAKLMEEADHVVRNVKSGASDVAGQVRHTGAQMIEGVEQADSFVCNPHKWLLTNFDCDCLFVADRSALVEALSIVPEYLRNAATESGAVVDYRDWQVPLGRRFRALKLWFVLRWYGAEGLRHHVREHVRLAGELADGVLLNYLPASHVPWSIEQVRRGEAKAGRPAGDCTVYAYVHAGVCERADGIDLARRDLFSYAVVDAYARNFERAGFADEVAAIRAAHAAKDREGALAAVSDRMVDAIDIMGDHDAVHAAVQAYVDAGVDVPVLMPLPWGPDRMAVVDATLRAAIGAPA